MSDGKAKSSRDIIARGGGGERGYGRLNSGAHPSLPANVHKRVFLTRLYRVREIDRVWEMSELARATSTTGVAGWEWEGERTDRGWDTRGELWRRTISSSCERDRSPPRTYINDVNSGRARIVLSLSCAHPRISRSRRVALRRYAWTPSAALNCSGAANFTIFVDVTPVHAGTGLCQGG